MPFLPVAQSSLTGSIGNYCHVIKAFAETGIFSFFTMASLYKERLLRTNHITPPKISFESQDFLFSVKEKLLFLY